jgi:hypothetical protein
MTNRSIETALPACAPRVTPPLRPSPSRRSVFRRDELLDARWSRYSGGIKLVSELDARRVRALLEEGYLSPTVCANGHAPTAMAFALFLSRWSMGARAAGYARSHRTSDGAVVLDELSLRLELLAPAERDRAWWEFHALCVDADGRDEDPARLRAWWE